jgi:type IV secretory pathway VirB10-like protein
MSAKTSTTPPNPVAGPAQPPGFTGLRRWTDLRFLAPLLLIAGAVWMFTQPLAITQLADARNVPDTGTMVIDSADLVARTPEPRDTAKPKPTATPYAQPSTVTAPTIAANDLGSTGLEPPPSVPGVANQPAVPPAPAAPPTPSAADIARQKKAAADQAALDAPLVSTPASAAPVPAPTSEDAHGGYWLRRGMSIPATLYTSIDSTVPGVIVAYVADDVYDFTHATLIIPRNAKLIGSFGGRDIGIAQGQARIPASFDSIQLADRVVALDDEPGIDRTGTSGLGARVDHHTRATIESFAILTGIGLIAHSNSCSNCEQSGSSNVGSAILSNGAPFVPQPNVIPPTLHVTEGAQISVMLTHDIRVQAWAP